MAFEIELKFLNANFATLRESIRLSGGVCKGAHLERNLVFDTPEFSFKERDMLLRLRSKRWANKDVTVMTLKRPPQDVQNMPTDVKVYDEHETIVKSFEGMQGILEGMGYNAAFRYDKMREEWKMDGVEICLDTLPFADVVEIEGSRESILLTAKKIGLTLDQSHTGTYHDLNSEYRAKNGLSVDHNFVFDEKKIINLIQNLEPCSTAGE